MANLTDSQLQKMQKRALDYVGGVHDRGCDAELMAADVTTLIYEVKRLKDLEHGLLRLMADGK